MKSTPVSLAVTRSVMLAMAIGPAIFAVLGYVLVSQKSMVQSTQWTPLVPLILLCLVMGSAGAYFILRRNFLQRARDTRQECKELLREGLLAPPLNQMLVIGSALAEAPALLAVVGYILTQELWLLGIPILSLALIVWQLPRRDTLEALLS